MEQIKMSKPLLKVKKPGLLTTIQDLGRGGFQQYGIVAAGAMDHYAMQMANLLVGNDRNEAVLEVSMVGPTLEALDNMIVAVCGGDLSARVNGEQIEGWKSFLLKKGQVLTFGAPLSGSRSYLSIAGGIDVPIIMGSKSTYLKAQMGGYEGRAIQREDIISGIGITEKRRIGRKLKSEYIPKYSHVIEARVVLGPHLDAFTQEGIKTFLNETYEISHQSDRMGYRLNGKKIRHKDTADIISDAIPFGGIQVPANGEPIILMADRQTTGGYTRIATVISSDLPFLAQALPGQKVCFKAITVQEAQHLYKSQEMKFRYVKCGGHLKKTI